MLPNKRLQIFISSTYTDLIKERQAAVEVILSSGHIPAGMELFTASDQSQMTVIRDWIDQSDIYLLILGGRYGSIEPISGKSYVQIEYEYALSKKKPTFAVVITNEHLEEKVKADGTKVIETEHQNQYLQFKNLVLSKMVKFWNDSKDIKLIIYETISEFSRRHELVGWVPGNLQIDTSKMAEQLARLSQENTKLSQEKIETQGNFYNTRAELLEKIAILEKNTRTINFKNLNPKSRGIIQKASINGQEIVLGTGEYNDGNIGEIFINMSKEGSTTRSLLECFALSVSLGLQYGVPLEDFIEKFVYTKFEPSGFVDHPNIKSATSILDFVFRVLGYEYLGRTDLVHVIDKPELMNTGADDWDEIPSNLEYAEQELSSVRIIPSSGYKSTNSSKDEEMK